MTIENALKAINDLSNINHLVKLINGNSRVEASAEALAAAYAVIWEYFEGPADNNLHSKNDKAQIVLNLEHLRDGGANFDFTKAISIAIAKVAAMHGHEYAGCTLVIDEGSCNGEEEQFAEFLRGKYPFMEVKIELVGGFYDPEGNPFEYSEDLEFWTEYCNEAMEE